MGGIVYRRASAGDFKATYDTFIAAANDLRARSGRSPVDDTPQRLRRALAFRRHALTYDPDGYWVAEADGRTVGFGIAILRQHFWHLAALHVLPAYQGRGVGRELLCRCLDMAFEPDAIQTVIAEATQPISNALYAKHRMYQWVPLLHVEGTATLLAVPEDLTAEPVQAQAKTLGTLDAIDLQVLGFTRTVDHQLWLGQPDLTGLVFHQADQAVGYAYISTFGGIGPVAVQSDAAMPSALALSIRSLASRGVEHLSLVVPGHCRTGLAYLLANGFRYGQDINLLLSSRPFGQLDRYFPSAGDALF